MRSMLPPTAAIWCVTAAMAAGSSGWPSTVMIMRPTRRGRLSPEPRSISTTNPRSPARSRAAASRASTSSGCVSRTLSMRRPRTTNCSTSTTSTANAESRSNKAVDTPGRSGPVKVNNTVGPDRCGLGTCSVIALRLPAASEAAVRWCNGCQRARVDERSEEHRLRLGIMSAAFDLSHVSVVRPGKFLLSDVSWRVEPGERWVVIGANGAGKTTLLQIIGAALYPTTGEAEVLGSKLGEVDVFDLRTRIGFAGASVADRIPPAESVLDAVMSAAHGVLGRWNEAYEGLDEDRAVQILSELGIGRLLQRTFGTLSEGERKRTLIA